MALGRVCFSLIVSLGLSAGQPGPGPHAPAPFPLLDLAEPLELTPKQMEQIQQKIEGHAKTLDVKREEAGKAHRALREALGETAITQEQLRTLANKASQAQLSELLEVHALLQETTALLTPEQRQRLAQFKAEGPRNVSTTLRQKGVRV